LLNSILQYFDRHLQSEQDDTEHRLRLATAALLIEVGRADFNWHDQEMLSISRLLQKQFDLSREEVDELVELASEEVEYSVSYHDFTRLINQSFEYSQKCQLVEMLWQIAYADQNLDKYEEALIRKIADLIYVRHSDFIKAKLKVRAGGY
jgi:uncharacterized tellurite resistance protein B-like protein